MEVKIYSQTGKPTDLEAAKGFEEEFKENYEKLDKQRVAKEISIDDMKQKLDEFDVYLKDKYDMYKTVKMPENVEEFKELIHAVQAPVTVAISEEDKELVLFIMDAEY